MKILRLILLSWMLMSFVFGQERTVIIDSRAIVLEVADGMDITTAGKWFVQFKQDDWIKKGKTLYPNKADRTRTVSDAQIAFKAEVDKYVIIALNLPAITVENKGTGVTLSARILFKYFAIEFKDGGLCRIYIRHENKQYTYRLFDNLADETAAATTARANMVTQLAIISTAADAGNFYE